MVADLLICLLTSSAFGDKEGCRNQAVTFLLVPMSICLASHCSWQFGIGDGVASPSHSAFVVNDFFLFCRTENHCVKSDFSLCVGMGGLSPGMACPSL
jgi:hypothetical protein